MHVSVVTLFPELFENFAKVSFVGRAVTSGALTLAFEPLREHGLGKYQSVDDTPYGGGSGMVMRVDCVVAALESAEQKLGARTHRVLLTPQGRPFDQRAAQELAREAHVTLVCGRYEGFDERVRGFVDRELSLGDFVMTGGEVAAMAVIESCVRLLPGVLGNADSPREESFSPECSGGLEYPQYTRPASFRGQDVPEVLSGGNHARIAKWRKQQALERTRARRPDLLAGDGAKDDEGS